MDYNTWPKNQTAERLLTFTPQKKEQDKIKRKPQLPSPNPSILLRQPQSSSIFWMEIHIGAMECHDQ